MLQVITSMTPRELKGLRAMITALLGEEPETRAGESAPTVSLSYIDEQAERISELGKRLDDVQVFLNKNEKRIEATRDLVNETRAAVSLQKDAQGSPPRSSTEQGARVEALEGDAVKQALQIKELVRGIEILKEYFAKHAEQVDARFADRVSNSGDQVEWVRELEEKLESLTARLDAMPKPRKRRSKADIEADKAAERAEEQAKEAEQAEEQAKEAAIVEEEAVALAEQEQPEQEQPEQEQPEQEQPEQVSALSAKEYKDAVSAITLKEGFIMRHQTTLKNWFKDRKLPTNISALPEELRPEFLDLLKTLDSE